MPVSQNEKASAAVMSDVVRERNPSRRDGADPARATIERHLRAHAGRYCSGATGDPEVVLLRLRSRAAARLYWYRIGSGSSARNVVVKVPGAPADAEVAGQPRRPRMVEPPPLDTKYVREYEALDLLQRHFSALDDPRFGAVPLLGRIDPARAIVMGEVEGRSLNELVPQLSRIYPRPPSALLRRAVQSAGAWLRAYHQLDLDGALPRQASRQDFVTNVQRYCSHLGVMLSRPVFFAGLADRLTAAAARLLPPELPLGLGHGDFAMRNVLVGQGGRIFVLDTTALWRTPVYADLAKFGLALRLSRVQAYSHGSAFREVSLRKAGRWLFEGYYGNQGGQGSQPVPEQRIRLYGILLLLDKWSFELALPPRGPVIARTVRRRLINSWYTGQARQMARELA